MLSFEKLVIRTSDSVLNNKVQCKNFFQSYIQRIPKFTQFQKSVIRSFKFENRLN